MLSTHAGCHGSLVAQPSMNAISVFMTLGCNLTDSGEF